MVKKHDNLKSLNEQANDNKSRIDDLYKKMDSIDKKAKKMYDAVESLSKMIASTKYFFIQEDKSMNVYIKSFGFFMLACVFYCFLMGAMIYVPAISAGYIESMTAILALVSIGFFSWRKVRRLVSLGRKNDAIIFTGWVSGIFVSYAGYVFFNFGSIHQLVANIGFNIATIMMMYAYSK